MKISTTLNKFTNAKNIDNNARIEEARNDLYISQMQHTALDYRELSLFDKELTYMVKKFYLSHSKTLQNK